jgi:hypothetical protein
MLGQNGSSAKGIAVYCLYNTPKQHGLIRAFPQTNLWRDSHPGDRADSCPGHRLSQNLFPIVLSRNGLLETEKRETLS